MLFNSLQFAIFLPIVFVLYWLVNNKSIKLQNLLLLSASYFFYSCWDVRFLLLLIFSTFLDYFTGIMIYKSSRASGKKLWLFISIIVNLGFLVFFKYYNFFIDSFAASLSQLGLSPNRASLNIILPVGISFYTFHGLSYVFDIYHNRIKPTTNWIEYSLFVSFFPLLVAGPIERATHLLPQIEKPRKFDYQKAADGLRQILWGQFKKVVIADGCAEYANLAFNNPDHYPASTLFLGVIFFAFQIYGDFSGYSDIALGTARLFGFELLQNFKFPYFSRDIAEFWRRWHISLSSWFKDYLYFPLGGSRGGKWMQIRNTFIIFLVSGFWHGANWTFIVWGFLNALFILPSIIVKTNRNNMNIVAPGKSFPTIQELLKMLSTFGLICFTWIFFRAESVAKAFHYISQLVSQTIFSRPAPGTFSVYIVVLVAVFILIEWRGREQKYAIEGLSVVKYKLVRWSVYTAIIFVIGMFMQTSETPFIYFQF